MKDFSDLDLRPLIFLALAGLRPQRKEGKLVSQKEKQSKTIFFSPDQIFNWISERGAKHSRGTFDNLLSDFKKNKNGINSFELKEKDETLSKVEEIVIFNKRHGNKYSLGPRTVENRLSAKLVRRLGEEAISCANVLPKSLENAVVEEIFEEFKTDYVFTSREDVEEKRDCAIDGLYFKRDKRGRLCPTDRYLEDEIDFIEHLSEPLPEPTSEILPKKRHTKAVETMPKAASTKRKAKGN